jgi:glycolate oxidase FAD binding subunit
MIDVSAQDQTLTASADTLLLDLYAALPERLHLPFPPAELPGGIGGLISRGGFAQTFFFGAEVLGLSFVAPNGKRVVAGGRTVKNVQGYDLTRPFVGSFGRLGVAESVTLRLRPGLFALHHARPGSLEDLPDGFLDGEGARFLWQDGGTLHAYHFGHEREVRAVMDVFGGEVYVGTLDYRSRFSAGMGVGPAENAEVKDRRFAWADGQTAPPVPAVFQRLISAL